MICLGIEGTAHSIGVGIISDDRPFAMGRPFNCKTVCFIKGSKWLLHHRDGLNHT